MRFISYYTPTYKLYVKVFIRRVRANILIDYIPEQNTWSIICRYKPYFVRNILTQLKETVVWCDIDINICDPNAVIKICQKFKTPLLAYPDDHYNISSGIIGFQYCDQTLSFIEKWIQLIEDNSKWLDHEALAIALIEYPLKVTYLPRELINFVPSNKNEEAKKFLLANREERLIVKERCEKCI